MSSSPQNNNIFNVLYHRYIQQIKLQQIENYNNRHIEYINRIGGNKNAIINSAKSKHLKSNNAESNHLKSNNAESNRVRGINKQDEIINNLNVKSNLHINVNNNHNKQVNHNNRRDVNNQEDQQEMQIFNNMKNHRINMNNRQQMPIKPLKQQRDLQQQLNINKPSFDTNKIINNNFLFKNTTNLISQKYQKPILALNTHSQQQFSQFPQQQQQPIELHQCPQGCGRRFKPQALQKHIKICQKIFQQKRKVFKVDIVDDQAKKLAKQKQKVNYNGNGNNKNGKNKNNFIGNNENQGERQKQKQKIPKWKRQSQRLRKGIRKVQANNNGNNGNSATTITQEELDDRTECPGCGRKFNQTAATRHIPNCVKKNKKK